MPMLKTEKNENTLNTRQFSLRKDADGKPSTFNREARTVDVVATTEDPVPVYDWDEGSIGEVLLMSGLKLPASRQVPLQDTHDRYSVRSTLGSARNLRIEKDAVIATVSFSRVADAEDAMTKVEEGHITDFSVGWRQHKAVMIPKNESQIIGGREFKGPLRVVTSWSIKELSIVPIGADERAKARSATYQDTEETNMKDALRKALEALGLRAGASDEEAWSFLELIGGKRDMGDDAALSFLAGRSASQPAGAEPSPQAGAAAPAEGVRAEAERAAQQAVQDLLKRAQDVRNMCSHYNCSELAESLITAGKTVEEARAAILDHITGARKTDGLHAPAGSFSFGADEKDKYRDAVSYALLKRSSLDISRIKDLKEAPGYDDFRSYRLSEIARDCLRRSGQRISGDIMVVVGRALTNSDLPAILANVANKSFYAGFDFHEETYETWTGVMSVGDFKQMSIPSISSLDDLLLVNEHGQYKYGFMRDKQETAQLGTGGRIYPITRQAIINDDLNAITIVFAGAGQKARKYTGDLCYALLTANPVMTEDGSTLFNNIVAHNNLATVIGLPAGATLDNMDSIIGSQVDPNGQALNIPLRYAIMPRTIKGSSESFFNTIMALDAVGAQINNTWGGSRLERVYEPRLNTAPATWYGAGPKGSTVVRVYLDGNETPYIEQKEGWTTDGVELKVRHDVTVGLVDWRGMVRNP